MTRINRRQHAYMKPDGIHENQRMTHCTQRKTENTKTETTHAIFEVLAAVMITKVFWDTRPCIQLVIELSRKYPKDGNRPPNLVTSYQSTWRHNLPHLNLQITDLLCRLSTFGKWHALDIILRKNSNYTSRPVTIKWKLRMINTDVIPKQAILPF